MKHPGQTAALPPRTYTLRIAAKGSAELVQEPVASSGPSSLDAPLQHATEKQVVHVKKELGSQRTIST